MGFHIELNTILRTEQAYDLAVGGKFDFRKTGSRLFFDDIPIWLTTMDWTALAEIQIVSQSRTAKDVSGAFQVLHVYTGDEQAAVTSIFRRMYSFAGQFDPYFYLLESRAVLNEAMARGFLVRHDLVEERFIHASPANQLTRVANKYYKDVKDLACAVVAKKRVMAEVKYEPATAGMYPHVYGPLNMDAVVRVLDVRPRENGEYVIDVEAMLGLSD
jgi:uncharacterized protein (DUF952 family)